MNGGVEQPLTDGEMRLSHGVPLTYAIRTDVGRVRANNEDAFGSKWLDDGSLLVVVCDGMGGHEAGEVASNLAVNVLSDVLTSTGVGDPQKAIYEGVLDANKAIIEEGRSGGKRGMGTTTVVSVVRGDEVFVGQVGDSRLYHIRDGHVIDRTVDHTRVESLLQRGLISEEEARDHPEAGMLTRALGHSKMSNGKPLEPEVYAEPIKIQEGDALVLCSDGLHDLAWDWEIAVVVAGSTPQEAADALVALALERGGHDNVTVAVLTVGPKAGAYVRQEGDEALMGGGQATQEVPHASKVPEAAKDQAAQATPVQPPAPAAPVSGAVEPDASPGRPADNAFIVLGFLGGMALFILAFAITLLAFVLLPS